MRRKCKVYQVYDHENEKYVPSKNETEYFLVGLSTYFNSLDSRTKAIIEHPSERNLQEVSINCIKMID